MTCSEKAHEIHKQGFNCAQAVFAAFAVFEKYMVKFNTAAVVIFPVLKGKVTLFQKLLNSG